MPATNYGVFAWILIVNCSVSILLLVSSVTCGQDPQIERLPTNLSEALLRLQMLDTGPTRQKQLEPVEFFAELPKNPLVSIESCRAAAEYSAKMDGRALVVLINDQPGYERYEPSWPRFKSHRLGNASECFVGVVAAKAVQDGLFNFDDPVSDTITEWADDSKKAVVTIRQLLTMTSGIEPGEVGYVATYKTAIQATLQNDPGKSFGYGANAFQIFGELICRKLAAKNGSYDPMGYVNYLDERILKPLKIEIGSWYKTPDEEANVSVGAFLSAVDLAKFGAMLCNGGTWEGEELIKKELLEEVLKGTEANPKYGMGFWLVSQNQDIEVSPETRMIMPSFGRTMIDGMYIAAGNGRQRLYVLPNEKIVIVRLGDPRVDLFRDETFFRNLLVKQDNP